MILVDNFLFFQPAQIQHASTRTLSVICSSPEVPGKNLDKISEEMEASGTVELGYEVTGE